MSTYRGDHAAGPDAVAHTHSHQVLVVWILAPPHQHLMAHEVGLLVHHEKAAFNPAGVTPAQVGGELGAVIAGLIGATLEVAVLVEYDLQRTMQTQRNILHENLPYCSFFTFRICL